MLITLNRHRHEIDASRIHRRIKLDGDRAAERYVKLAVGGNRIGDLQGIGHKFQILFDRIDTIQLTGKKRQVGDKIRRFLTH